MNNHHIKRMPRIEMASRMQSEVNEVALSVRNMMLNDGKDDRARQVERITTSRREIQGNLERLDAELANPQARAVLAQQHALNDKYVKNSDALMRLIDAGDADAARRYLAQELRQVAAAYKEATARQIALQQDLGKETARGAVHV